jgi:hypothetical protein
LKKNFRMKVITLLFSISFLTNIYAQEFEIIETTAQKWAGGQEQTGHGVLYTITLKTKKNSQKLILDKLWVGSDFFTIKPYKHTGNENVENFNDGDTLFTNARSRIAPSRLVDDEKDIKQYIEKEKPPFNYKGIALIGYIYKGKRKFKSIEAFIELKPVYHP